jgi:hypothetical protein
MQEINLPPFKSNVGLVGSHAMTGKARTKPSSPSDPRTSICPDRL